MFVAVLNLVALIVPVNAKLVDKLRDDYEWGLGETLSRSANKCKEFNPRDRNLIPARPFRS